LDRCRGFSKELSKEAGKNGRLEMSTILTLEVRRVREQRRDYLLKKEKEEEHHERGSRMAEKDRETKTAEKSSKQF
jgi:hypothetical protein